MKKEILEFFKTNKYWKLLLIIILIIIYFNKNSKIGEYKTDLNTSDAKYHEIFEQITLRQGSKQAFEFLREELKNNPQLVSRCHNFTHTIGHASITKTQNFDKALEELDNLCGSGYIHGVIELYLQQNAFLVSDIITICDRVSPKIFEKCLHGMGHGYMWVSDYNLSEAIKLCQQHLLFKKISRCAEGVFMEFFDDFDFLVKKNNLKVNLQSICHNQFANVQGVCYFYRAMAVLSDNKYDFQKSLNECNFVDQIFINICQKGVGSRLMKYNLHNIEFVKNVCNLDSISRLNCAQGAISYHLVHYDDPTLTKKLCHLTFWDMWASPACEKYIEQIYY